MDINETTIENMENLAIKKIMELYDDLIQKEDVQDVDNGGLALINCKQAVEIINEAINRALKNSTSKEYILESSRLVKSRIAKTKKRWFDSDILNDSYIKEIDNIIVNLKRYSIPLSAYLASIGSESFEQHKKDILVKSNNWLEDKDKFLGEYPCLKNKSKRQLEAAIKNDVEIICYDYLLEKNEDNKCQILSIPQQFTGYPIDFTNSQIKLDQEYIENAINKNETYIDLDIIELGDYTFKSRYEVSMFKKKTIYSTVKRLGEFDQRMIGYLLSKRDKDFFKTREVVAPIGEIVNSVLNYNSGVGYTNVKAGLFRLQYLNIIAISTKFTGFSSKILDNVEIITVDGKEIAYVLFNEDVVQQVVDNRTVNMYGEIINGFTNPMSRPLILNLQVERIKLAAEGNYKFTANYETFRRYLFFRDNKRIRNIRRICDALDEIAASGKTVKSYERINDEFIFEFYPITDREREDLFKGISFDDNKFELLELK